jgi:MarC family integral membrane protein
LDSVRGNDDVRRIGLAGCEVQPDDKVALFEGDATMTPAYCGRRETCGEYPQQISPVHSIDAIPTTRVGGDDSTDKRSIHAVVGRPLADPCTDLGECVAQIHSFKLSPTIGKEGKAGAALQLVSLLPGGVLLFGVATRMVFGQHLQQEGQAETAAREKIADLAAFSLAIPLIAGPGAITATLLLATHTSGDPLRLVALLAIIAVIAGLAALSFLSAGYLERLLGRTGNIVIARLLGILLAAFATQFVVDGINGAFHLAI